MTHHRRHRERGASRRTVRARTSLGIAQAADYVEVLAHALRAGGVTVRSGGELVALQAGERVELEVQAGEEGTHSVVRLTLRWETPMPEERLEIVPGVEQTGASGAGPDTGVGGGPSGE
jgi:amphi-Trp domain-containing protein